MRHIILYSSLCVSLLYVGCSTLRTDKYSNESINRSLFNDKDRTIGEDDIQKLLDNHFALPNTLRVAVYKLGTTNSYHYRYYGYGDEVGVKSQQLYMDTLSAILQSDTKIKRVNLVPSLMIAAQPTITQLREAAVRLQCDILLVFASTSDIYNRYRAFKKNETKAYATTEAFVMDIRTGLIPFSTLITKDFLTQKQSPEKEDETMRRAQSEAVLKTLSEVGKQVNLFLSSRE